MGSLQLFSSNFSQASLPNSTTANYAQNPSWASLKTNRFSLKTSGGHQSGELANVHLVYLSKQNKLEDAHEFLLEMDRNQIHVSPQSYVQLLKACLRLKSVDIGKLLRRRLKNLSGFPVHYLIQVFCDCGCLSDAQEVFDEMVERTLTSGTLLISAYADRGMSVEALENFQKVRDSNFRLKASVFLSVLKSFVGSSHLEVGKQIHCQVIKAGFNNNVAIDTAICNMYVKCRQLEPAEMYFSRMLEKNTVSWTTMMVGYTLVDCHEDALNCFSRMVCQNFDLDEFVFSISLKACAALSDHKMGEQIHGWIVKLGMETEVSAGTPLVDFYVKCQDMESACRAFEKISEPNDVSWSAILSGYSQVGEFEKCVKCFKSLRIEGVLLNECIFTSIFQVCSAFADLSFGSQAHGDAIKRALVSQPRGESAMITMYAKCGRLDYALQMFQSIDEPDTIAWTAIICGFAYHGNALEALKFFKEMQDSGVGANAVTFVAVFTACSHAGLVQEAKQYLERMSSKYGVEPNLGHYNCMVDVYSRAGLLKEALHLIKTMPFEPDAMSWKSLLGGCTIHKDNNIGKDAAEKLLHLDPKDTAAYILLFNLHASSGNWEESARVRKLMAERELTKEVGCSWISVKGKIHRFVVGDQHHDQTEEIYSKLEELNFSSKGDEFLTEDDGVSIIGTARRKQSLVHSEKLAIAFGLISTQPNCPILVFKNLRACRDCHEFCKYVSMATGRTIVVRDSNRFHHFTSGECSCGDYW